MRVYAPATRADLLTLHTSGRWAATGPCFAVTAGLREWVQADGPADDEELELVAMTEAARECLRLLGPDTDARHAARTVLALDVDAAHVQVDDTGPQDPPGRVRLTGGPVPVSQVAAVHADSQDATPAVAAAIAAFAAAEAGDPTAETVLGRLDDHDLLWFHPGEITLVLAGAPSSRPPTDPG